MRSADIKISLFQLIQDTTEMDEMDDYVHFRFIETIKQFILESVCHCWPYNGVEMRLPTSTDHY